MLEQHRFSAFLFDMDGTLTNSVAAAERVWSQWAEGKGLNVADFLPTIHGVRCIDTLRRLNLPGVDPEREADLLAQAEIDDVEGVVSIMVSAEDVEHGKPAPDCFLLAAKKLGVKPAECLVFEDAPAGIAAAEAAGAKVMVITAAHQHLIETAHPTLTTYDSYGVVLDDQGFLQLRSS
jgi:sugar-phosphatase